MAIANAWSIDYGGVTIGGGSSTYLLDGTYRLDKAFDSIRCTFAVTVTVPNTGDAAADIAAFQTACEYIEQGFDRRDQNLTITLQASPFVGWSYSHGTSALNVTASISKSGDPATDHGLSRRYTGVVEAEIPATDSDGLREVESNVQTQPSGRKIVTFRGVYTTIGGAGARQTFESEWGTEADIFLAALDNSEPWELVDQSASQDRNNHICSFSQQWVQLLERQTKQNFDDDRVADHRVQFREEGVFTGDSLKDVWRLRTVACSYSCAVVFTEATDKHELYRTAVRPYILDTFKADFKPKKFAVEDHQVFFDETDSRLSVSMRITYQPKGGGNVLEVQQSVEYQESRTPDYTPVHSGREYDAYVDQGFAERIRIWSRTVIVLGSQLPIRRIGTTDPGGNAGKFGQAIEDYGFEADRAGMDGVRASGWNRIRNRSNVTNKWIGDPGQGTDEKQLLVSVLTETVAERWSTEPGGISVVSGNAGGLAPGGGG